MSRRLDQPPVHSEGIGFSDVEDGGEPSPDPSRGHATERTEAAEAVDDPIVRWFTAGAVLGGIVYLYMAMAGSFDLLQLTPGGNRFDDQAKSVLAGHLYVDPSVATIESFLSGGRSYLYFGLFPALLRLPVKAVTDRFDGRLGGLSIMLSLVVTVAAVRMVVRQFSPTRSEGFVNRRLAAGVAALFGFALTGGSIVLYLGGRGTMYNEAIAWGLAGAVATASLLLRFARSGQSAYLWWAGLAATIAISSRVTLGLGATASIAMTGAAMLLPRLRSWSALDRTTPPKHVGAVFAVVTLLPLLSFGVVQYAKFGSIGVRPSQHIANINSESFERYRAANGDTLFSPNFVASNALALVVWPSRLELDDEYPWIRPIDGAMAPTPGDPVFLGRTWSGSLLATQSVMFVLAIAGAVSVFARRREIDADGVEPAHARPVVAGLFIGVAPTLAYAYQYHRFLGDAFAVVLILAAIAVGTSIPLRRLSARWAVTAGAAALVMTAWTVWVNVALTALDQSERAWAPQPSVLRHLLDIRLDSPGDVDTVPAGLGEQLPVPNAMGDVLLIGDCDATFLTTGLDGFDLTWSPVELGPGFKRVFEVDPDALVPGQSVTIMTDGGTPGRAVFLSATDEEFRVAATDSAASLALERGAHHRLTATYDPVWQALTLEGPHRARITAPWTRPFDQTATRATPGITDLGGDPTRLCSRLD